MTEATPNLLEALATALRKRDIPDGVIHAICAEICTAWGGEDHWIPKRWRPGRDAVIADHVARGATTQQTATAAQCGVATVVRVRRKLTRRGPAADDWYL